MNAFVNVNIFENPFTKIYRKFLQNSSGKIIVETQREIKFIPCHKTEINKYINICCIPTLKETDKNIVNWKVLY